MEYPTIDDLLEDVTELKQSDETIIRTRKINGYTILYSIYGKKVQDYISRSFGFKANDPYSYANEVNVMLFKELFSDRYAMDFNQIIQMEKEIYIEKLEELVEQGISLKETLEKMKKMPKEYIKMEIDATIEVHQKAEPPRSFEIKMYTSPKQSNRLLAEYLEHKPLSSYLSTRDFLGFITFSTIHDKDNSAQRIEYPLDFPEYARYEWVLHFCVLDRKVLLEISTSKEKANDLTKGIVEDQQFFYDELKLNRVNGSISLIENYVKVVEMSYQIEKLKISLEKEQEARKRAEKARIGEEEARKRAEKAKIREEEKNKRLEKIIRDAGIALPDDDEINDEQ